MNNEEWTINNEYSGRDVKGLGDNQHNIIYALRNELSHNIVCSFSQNVRFLNQKRSLGNG